MNENENNFEALRQLMALKRHEIPPPGYFEGFAGGVTSRIRAGEAVEHGGFAKRLAAEAPWLFNFLNIFQAKPAFVGGFASALCLLLLFGIVFAERPDSMPTTSLQLLAASGASQATAPAVTPAANASAPQSSAPADLALNTNSSLQPVDSVFASGNALFQNTSYLLPGN